MTVVQRKAMLKAEGFFPHKKNGKGTSIIYSRKHPTAKFVRVVVDSGIDSKTNKIGMVRGGKVGVKLCYINRQKQWREITTEVFTTNTGLAKTIKAQEAAEKFVKTCKHCKAKKFTAKSGNVVCANACWTTWGNKKKNATTKKTAQKKPQKIAAKKSQKKSPNIMVGKVESKRKKIAEKIFTAEILPGDLVTVEQIQGEKVTENFTGKILGIVKSVKDNAVDVDWTANTSSLEDWCLPRWKTVVIPHRNEMIDYRFKVLSREVKYTVVT